MRDYQVIVIRIIIIIISMKIFRGTKIIFSSSGPDGPLPFTKIGEAKDLLLPYQLKEDLEEFVLCRIPLSLKFPQGVNLHID
jgi:hypothetical protein